MNGDSAVERLIHAARQRSGERLELTSDRPAVLVRGAERLQAGKAVLAVEELETWLEGVIAHDRWLAFQLGQEIRETVTIGEERLWVRARHTGGVVQLAIGLGPGAGDGATAAGPAAPVAVAPELTGPSEPSPAHSAGRATSPARRPPASMERPLDRLLVKLVELGGSDLHLTATCPPMIRLHGDMATFPDGALPLSSEHILLMCQEVAPAANRREFREERDTDFAYEIPDVARFRVNLFHDRHGIGAVFRQIPTEIRSLDELGLPECVKSLCALNQGLILVTGPTGSGKSTTLAAMLDRMNERRAEHIITIEDPIEFVHPNKRSLVNQREVGSHTESFKRALRAALREDPDIVLVGELRDLETMAIAIETAETGHLVLATLHTTTAVSTVDRLIDQFPADRQEQIRVMLSESLKGVIAQILLKRVGGGRVAAYEILLGVPAVANLIREGKTFQIPSIMQTAKRLGMRQMNDSLAELVKGGTIDLDEALAKSTDREALRSLLKLAKEGDGTSFDTVSGRV
ncbi:MAG: type IV pilus twitching motility protein PilT [Acidobacteriota bacterium]